MGDDAGRALFLCWPQAMSAAGPDAHFLSLSSVSLFLSRDLPPRATTHPSWQGVYRSGGEQVKQGPYRTIDGVQDRAVAHDQSRDQAAGARQR
jgi:hypothetical protein